MTPEKPISDVSIRAEIESALDAAVAERRLVPAPNPVADEKLREARKLCAVQNIYWDKSQPTTHYMTEADAVALAKKYRG